MSLRVNNKLWLISDTHFGHKNIIKFQQRPESHEVIILDKWIRFVRDEDQILHLGDVFMGKQGNPERWARVLSRMPGEKFLILGNHDFKKNSSKHSLYDLAGFEVIEPFIVNGFAFTHRPIAEDFPHLGRSAAEMGTEYGNYEAVDQSGWHTNIHGHTHGNLYEPGNKWAGPGYWNHNYINVCVEMTSLGPVQLGQVWR